MLIHKMVGVKYSFVRYSPTVWEGQIENSWNGGRKIKSKAVHTLHMHNVNVTERRKEKHLNIHKMRERET